MCLSCFYLKTGTGVFKRIYKYKALLLVALMLVFHKVLATSLMLSAKQHYLTVNCNGFTNVLFRFFSYQARCRHWRAFG